MSTDAFLPEQWHQRLRVAALLAVVAITLAAAANAPARPYGAGLYNSGVYEACLPPYPIADQTGDCRVQLDDLAIFASDWLRCNDPENPACEWPW